MKEKKSRQEQVNKIINDLVYEKISIIKAYNYYHGKRDPEQFRHLEENYGIGTPTSVEFVPLVRKHIDVLVGEYLSTPVLPRISCKDSETLSNIHRDKQLAINKSVVSELKTHLENSIMGIIKGDPKIAEDKEVANRIQKVQEATERNFISDYEIAGQNVVDYSMQSRNIDFANKRKILIIDLLASGTCYYKAEPTPSKTNINLRILNPVNTFIDRNPESPYLKKSNRSVIREYLTQQQILAKYGSYITSDDLEQIKSWSKFGAEDFSATYLRSYDAAEVGNVDGILGGFEITSLIPGEGPTSKYYSTVPVYEVEWLETIKEGDKFVTHRETSVRIGNAIYIHYETDYGVTRSMDNPNDCDISVNGMFYADRNGDPFSIILATANLQDKFDCLNFFRDNIIAESGSVGDWIDMAHLPKFLGTNATERLLKWKGYKKTGLALYDTSQEGIPLNTAFNGFDDTIKLQTIQAIDLAIQRVEETCSTITGVFREKLGGIEQRDAVSNVQVGVKNSTLITKQYYQVMDLMTREMLIDMLNHAKVVFKNGLSGTLILGERLNKIFTALPEHFTFTDYDIHISDSSEVVKDQETIKGLLIELSKGGAVDPEILIEVATSKSLTRMKVDVLNAINKKKEENSQLQQLSEQVQQLDQQLKETTTQNQKLNQEVQKLDTDKTQLDKAKFEYEKEIGWFRAKSEDEYRDAQLEEERKRVQLEGAQLLDNNKNNDEVRND